MGANRIFGTNVARQPAVAVLLAATLLAGCVAPRERVSSRPPQGAGQQPWEPAPRPRPVPVVRADPGVNRPPVGLAAAVHELWRAFPGRTGIAIRRIDGDWAIDERGQEYFPQQSVSKLWVALTLLDRVDRGEARLDQQLRITPDDLTLFHQPLASRVRRDGEVEESAGELLEQAITGSDNTANDTLLRYAGGPEAVRAFLTRNDLGKIRYGPGERLLQSRIAGLEWQQRYSVGSNFQVARNGVPLAIRRQALDRYLADPEDGASPLAITAALGRLARGELLSPQSTRLILGTLARTRSGPQRLRAGVPAGWQVMHKTGTGQELGGTATGYNDIGILTAPDGTRYAVAVMLGDTTASIPERMRLMQGVSALVAQYHGQ